MDRISRALEQARNKIAKVHVDPDVEINRNVSYTKSKSVALDPLLLQENRVLTDMDDGRIKDTYGLLRTRVLQIMRQNNWKTLGVTSPNPSAGKTLTVINLAISIAQEHNSSALLVDADLRKPGVSKTLGILPEYGLDAYLTEETKLEDVFLYPEIKHLVVIPTNQVKGGSAELLSSPRMTNFIEQAKQRYPERIVLYDLPPLLVGDDVLAVLPHLDALLLVAEDGKTQVDEFKHAIGLLQDTNVIGVVLNKALVANNDSGYY